MRAKWLLSALIVVLSCSPAFAARENLDEAMARKARYSTNTYYSGESGANYAWQPETLTWTDTTTGHEVWRLVWKPLDEDIIGKEYAIPSAFSHDGSRVGFFNYGLTRTSGDPSHDAANRRWIVKTDGSGLRAGTGIGRSVGEGGFNWAHTEAAYYDFPTSASECSGCAVDKLYKCSYDANDAFTCSSVLQVGDGRSKLLVKSSVTSRDSWIVALDGDEHDYATPNNINSRGTFWIGLDGSPAVDYTWGIARGMGPSPGTDPYGNHVWSNELRWHGGGAFVRNPDAASLLLVYSGDGIFFDLDSHGSDTDGGPQWSDWTGSSFGEIRALSDDIGNSYTPHNPYNNAYMGHPSPDAWGHYILFASNQDAGDGCRTGVNCAPGKVIADWSNYLANPFWVDASNSNYPFTFGSYVGGHSAWSGWTDYMTSADEGDLHLLGNFYTSTTQTGKTNYRAADSLVTTDTPGYQDNYNVYPRPVQSPDGTKLLYSTALFHSAYAGTNSDDDYVGLAYVVAYYPYPPEITQATASSGTVTIRFDWRDSTASPRTYTARGWPDESTNDPPIPRETRLFRLWVSSNGSTWAPVSSGTVDAEPFSRFDFVSGGFKAGQNSYWEIGATQTASTTRYYGVTALEWSGLESRALSNVWKVTLDGSGDIATQEQQTAYPAAPGAANGFYTTKPAAPSALTATHQQSPATEAGQYTLAWTEPADASLVRAYNIYALDGSVPAISQTRRISTVPVGTASWVDWLGAIDGTTRYAITALDVQGNESDGAVDGGGSIYMGGDRGYSGGSFSGVMQ